MPKSRVITRENRKREQMLDRKNSFGHTDLTAYEAVKRIMRKQKPTQKTGTATGA